MSGRKWKILSFWERERFLAVPVALGLDASDLSCVVPKYVGDSPGPCDECKLFDIPVALRRLVCFVALSETEWEILNHYPRVFVPAPLIEEFEVPDDVKGTHEEVNQESEDVVNAFLGAGVKG